MVGAFLIALLVGAIVYFTGKLFDKTPNNQYAGLAGLFAFLVVFLGYYTVYS